MPLQRDGRDRRRPADGFDLPGSTSWFVFHRFNPVSMTV